MQKAREMACWVLSEFLRQCRSNRMFVRTGLAIGLACAAVGTQAQTPRHRFHTPKASSQQANTASTQSEWPYATGGITPARRTETSTKTESGQVVTQRLETPGIYGRYQLLTETEEETIEVDANTTRVIRRLFARDARGRRQVIEVTEEEHHRLPNDGERIVRNTSQPTLDGHFQLTRRDIEETTQVTPTMRQTRTTVSHPDINGGLTPVEQISETEQEKEPGVLVVERTQLLLDGNGRWEPHETRERVIRSQGGEVRTEEQVYRKDANFQMSLAERTVTREWKDEQGAEHQTTQVYSDNISGNTHSADDRLHLDRELRIVRQTRSDGSQQTIQELGQRSTVAPSSPLRVTERVVTFSRPVGRGGAQTQKTVQALDANGRYQTIIVLQVNESNPESP